MLRGLKLSDGMRWGGAAVPHQQADAAAILSTDPDAPKLHYLTRPRGGSKSTDIALVLLTLLITGRLGHGDIAYCFAVDRDQARLLLDAMRRVAHATGLGPDLVTFGPYLAESPRHGGRVEVRPADAGGSWGLLPAFLVVDEVAQWPTTPTHAETFRAILSSQPKTGCPLVLATSAGSPSHFSWKLLEQAKASPRWQVSEMAGPVQWLDADALEEQRRLLRPSEYARLHENRWVEPEDSLATGEDVAAAAVLDGPLDYNPSHRYVIGLDVGVKRDRTAVVVSHLEWPDRRVYEPVGDLSRVPDRSVAPTVVVDRRLLWVPSRGRRTDRSGARGPRGGPHVSGEGDCRPLASPGDGAAVACGGGRGDGARFLADLGVAAGVHLVRVVA